MTDNRWILILQALVILATFIPIILVFMEISERQKKSEREEKERIKNAKTLKRNWIYFSTSHGVYYKNSYNRGFYCSHCGKINYLILRKGFEFPKKLRCKGCHCLSKTNEEYDPEEVALSLI